MPCSAPLPVPTIMATGVASPNAQGQEITSTEMAQDRANSKVCPSSSQTTAVSSAMQITTGTNTPAMRSAILAMGALVADASSTSRIIWAKVVSLPTLDAVKRMKPPLLMVAAITVSPGSFSTGMLSPVMADWSTLVLPWVICPSTGMLLPRFYYNGVSHQHLLNRDFHLLAVALHSGGFGRQIHQAGQCFAGLAFGAGFQIFAHRNQRQNHNR